jgi:hypothetical protein
MGEVKGNPFVPFQITYIETDKPIGKYVPMNPSVTPCNKGISVSTEITFLHYGTSFRAKKMYRLECEDD